MPVYLRDKRALRALSIGLIAAAMLAAFLLARTPAPAAVQNNTVEYSLKARPGADPSVDVRLTFNLGAGSEAELEVPPDGPAAGGGPSGPTFELLSKPVSQYKVEPLPEGGSGWRISATSARKVSIDYRVGLAASEGPQNASSGPGSDDSALIVVQAGLTVLRGSDALLVPRSANGRPVSDDFRVTITGMASEDAAAPFEATGGKADYIISGVDPLLGNYYSWGKMATEKYRMGSTSAGIWMAGNLSGLSGDKRKAYCSDFTALCDELQNVAGQRAELPLLTVVVVDSRESGYRSPAGQAQLASVAYTGAGDRLTGVGAETASAAIFDLWNRWSMLPKKGGEAEWFQAGLSGLYGPRGAALAGLIDRDRAYADFADVYSSYVANPLARKTSLLDAQGSGASQFVSEKATVLVAAIDKRLRAQTGNSKDIDWLVGQMAKKYDHFKGHDYTLVDVEEMLEDATGKSWARFFGDGVRSTAIIGASAFSQSELFGPEASAGRRLTSRGSGKSWLFLLIGLGVILSVPIAFGTYVRRSVNLDLTMPKILPDDDE